MSDDRASHPGPSLPQKPEDGGRDPVDLIVEDYIERQRRGESPRIDEYTGAHPELAEELREALGALESLARLRSVPADSGTPMRRVGEYRIVRELGRGGMGVVYEAEQESLGRRVALKILAAHALLDPRQLERFRREAQAAAGLQHPSIVPVYGVGEHEGVHYYTMQFIPGRGLDEVLDDVRRLLHEPGPRRARGAAAPASSSPGSSPGSSPSATSSALLSGSSSPGRPSVQAYHSNVSRIGVELAEALAYAHGSGIVHRDIKPSNILLDSEGKVWIADFGLARADDRDVSALTRSDELVGTLRYLAPECLEGRSDHLVDVYGLGLTLYEALTLRPAFEGSDRRALLKKVASEEPAAPRRIDSRIPRDLETIVLKAIEKAPERRYASAMELAEDLRRFLAGRPLAARRASALERCWLWSRRNPVVASLSACVVVSLVATAAISTVMMLRMRESLREAYFDRARASRLSHQVGQRAGSLEALRRAAAIRPSRAMRDEAIAAMSRADLVEERRWRWPDGLAVRCFDAGLERYAVSHRDGRVVIRDSEGHASLLELAGDGKRAYETAFSPDGRYVAANLGRRFRNRFRLWEIETGDLVVDRPSPGAGRSSARFDFTADSRTLVLAWQEGGVEVLESATGRVLGRFAVADGSLDRIALHPVSRQLAVYLKKTGRIVVVDIDSGATLSEIAAVGGVRDLTWQPHGRLLAAAAGSSITIWDPRSPGPPHAVLRGHDDDVFDVRFHADGEWLVSSGFDRSVRLWDTGSGSEILSLRGRQAQFSDDGRHLAVWSGTRARIYRVEPRPEFRSLRTAASARPGPQEIDVSRDGRWLAAADRDGLWVWRLGDGREVAHVAGLRAISVKFLAGGRGLVTCGEDGLLRWPFESTAGEPGLGPSQRLLDRPDLLRVDVDDSGVLAVTSNPEQGAFVLDLHRPGPPLLLKPHRRLESVAVAPGGRWIATSGWLADSVKVWDRGTGTCAVELPVRRAGAEFDRQGRWLVTAAADAYRFWSVGDWRERRVIPREDAAGPGCLDFGAGGELVAITHADRRVHLLAVDTLVEVASFEAPNPLPISGVVFSRCGERLAVASGQHVIDVWAVEAVRARLASMGLGW